MTRPVLTAGHNIYRNSIEKNAGYIGTQRPGKHSLCSRQCASLWRVFSMWSRVSIDAGFFVCVGPCAGVSHVEVNSSGLHQRCIGTGSICRHNIDYLLNWGGQLYQSIKRCVFEIFRNEPV